MRIIVALASLLLPGCLSAPPDAIGDGATSDAADALAACASDLTLTLRSAQELDAWKRENGAECVQEHTAEGLEFTNYGSPATCRAYADRLVDLRNTQRLRLRLVDHAPDLSMAFSVVVGAPETPLSQRRWLYFERDNGLLMFGECNQEIGGCSDTSWGSIDYVPLDHSWLSFKYEADGSVLYLETSRDGNTFDMAAGPIDVSEADVACVAVDLGSYELDTGELPRRSSFADLIFQ
jgi:hypothetical protein